MPIQKPLTPAQVRARFHARGETTAAWARKHGYRLQAVYRVMGGQDKASYGKAHEIAIALGLKLPDPTAEGSTPRGGCNPQMAAE
jgi:gp16 family phage-associated protein